MKEKEGIITLLLLFLVWLWVGGIIIGYLVVFHGMNSITGTNIILSPIYIFIIWALFKIIQIKKQRKKNEIQKDETMDS